jgi:hypothetical protein
MTQSITRELTSKQKLFLEALSSKEIAGDIRAAMRAAGYSDNSPLQIVLGPLRNEIIEIGETILAAHSVQASFGLVDSMNNPSKPGTNNKIAAAKELLDRAGLGKKGEGGGTTVQTQNIFIMPAKDPIKTIDVTPNVLSTIEDRVKDTIYFDVTKDHDEDSIKIVNPPLTEDSI